MCDFNHQSPNQHPHHVMSVGIGWMFLWQNYFLNPTPALVSLSWYHWKFEIMVVVVMWDLMEVSIGWPDLVCGTPALKMCHHTCALVSMTPVWFFFADENYVEHTSRLYSSAKSASASASNLPVTWRDKSAPSLLLTAIAVLALAPSSITLY